MVEQPPQSLNPALTVRIPSSPSSQPRLTLRPHLYHLLVFAMKPYFGYFLIENYNNYWLNDFKINVLTKKIYAYQ